MSRRTPDCTFAAGSRDQPKCSLATDLLPLPCYPATLSVVTTDTMRLVSSGEESSNDPERRLSRSEKITSEIFLRQKLDRAKLLLYSEEVLEYLQSIQEGDIIIVREIPNACSSWSFRSSKYTVTFAR